MRWVATFTSASHSTCKCDSLDNSRRRASARRFLLPSLVAERSMQRPAEDLDEEQAADRAAARGDLAEARALLERMTIRSPERKELWLKLGAIRKGANDLKGALEAISGALRVDPLDFVALLSRGHILESAGRPRDAARDYIRALAQISEEDAVAAFPLALQPLIDNARKRAAAYQAQVGLTWDRAIATDPNLNPREQERLWRFKSNALRETRIFHCDPTHYHYPGLAEREFHEPEDFPWLARLKAATAQIKSEFEALATERSARAEPYVQYAADAPARQWATLNNSLDWTAFHLTRGGALVGENARRCPKTMAVLAAIPQPRITGRSPNAMFSLLRPHTRIPPHTGIANTRLVCHLPLIVPEDCWFRVGATRRAWRVGEAFLFDDTIEHEAANESIHPRVVLIIDVWHPGLSKSERAAVTRIMEADEAEHGAPI